MLTMYLCMSMPMEDWESFERCVGMTLKLLASTQMLVSHDSWLRYACVLPQVSCRWGFILFTWSVEYGVHFE